jgi:ADP-heptose:LPS heptosyltransferase
LWGFSYLLEEYRQVSAAATGYHCCMRLALLRLSALGDILRVLPAWKNIVRAFPDAGIKAVIEDRHAFLLEHLPEIEPIIVRRKKLSNPISAIAELRRAGMQLKGTDVSLDFHGILKSALIPYFAGIRERWGDGHSKEGAGLLQNSFAAKKKQSRYAQALGLAEAFGQKHGMQDLGRFEPALKDARLPICEAWPAGGSAKRSRMVLVPGTSNAGAIKRWSLENWIRLAKELQGAADLRWSLGPDEEAWRDSLPEKSGVEALPRLTFWELASAIRSADRVIVGDTGILHLSVLLGVQVTALMGPSDPIISGLPPGCGAMLHAGVECSPCRERRCIRRSCMEQLHVKMILETL